MRSLLIFSFLSLLMVGMSASANPPAGGGNTFNRLMAPKPAANLPPAEDGIHDPANPSTYDLQHPLEAFSALVDSKFGNQVDWVKSLDEAKFSPRANLTDPNVKSIVMNLNIVREVKGSMPNVVFPHDKHTAVLTCANCHPAIFIPQKGANQISMANIMLGQTCGVCHGSVAFPVETVTCTLCHSQPKDETFELKRTQAGGQ